MKNFTCFIHIFCLIFISSVFAVEDETCSTQSELSPSAELSNTERTFIAIKPDGVQRGLVGKIIQRFEQRGFKLVAMKMVHATKEQLQIHYSDLKDKPFFASLIDYVHSGPMVAMIWEGLDAVKQGRKMLGETNPLQSAPGTIRGDFSLQTSRNIIHGSDSVESANKEIGHWFRPDEILTFEFANKQWIYE